MKVAQRGGLPGLLDALEALRERGEPYVLGIIVRDDPDRRIKNPA